MFTHDEVEKKLDTNIIHAPRPPIKISVTALKYSYPISSKQKII